MKIKVDYVTNSSSEVFSVVLVDSAVVVALVAGITALANATFASAASGLAEALIWPDPTLDETDTKLEDAHRISRELSKAVQEDAKNQDKLLIQAFKELDAVREMAEVSLTMEKSHVDELLEMSEEEINERLDADPELKDRVETLWASRKDGE